MIYDVRTIPDVFSKRFLIASFILALFLSFSVNAIIALAIILSLLLCYMVFREKGMVFLIVLGYFLITSDMDEQFRTAFNIVALLSLVFLFLKTYGLELKLYPRIPNIILPLLALTLISITVSTLLSVSLGTSIIYFGKQIIFLLLCYTIYALNIRYGLTKILLFSVLIAGVVLAVSVVNEFAENIADFISFGKTKVLLRFSGLYENPNSIGFFMTAAIPCAIYFLLNNFKYSKSKLLFIFIVLLLFLSLLLGNSRSSIISVLISMSYIILKLRPKLFIHMFIVVLCMLGVFLIFESSRDLILLYIRFERIFETTRNHYWNIAFSIFSDNPLFGSGPGTFEFFVYKYLPVMQGTFTEQQLWWAKSGTAHNFYLFRLSELGLLGFINAIYFIYIIFHIPSYLLKNFKFDKQSRYLLIIFKSIVIGLFLRSFIESNGFLTHGWITRDLPFWIFIIIILSAFKSQLSEKPDKNILEQTR